MLKEDYTNFFDSNADLLVIPVSGDGTGSEWLDKCATKWPDLKTNYESLYKAKKLKTGRIVLSYTSILNGIPVFFAVTRTASYMTTREISVTNILNALQKYCRTEKVTKVAMTRLGHKEGLSWEKWTRMQYVRVLEFEMGTEFHVYLY